VLGQQILVETTSEDPESLFKRCGGREIGILSDFLRLWTRSIIELLEQLRETAPDGGMLSEIHYWRDIARVLEAINSELK
jgi:hypothetical protein